MTARHLQSGSDAERQARNYLEARGLRTLCTNFRCRAGELDLIMLDKGCLAIVEVRYRRRTGHGGSLASVTRAKQQRIVLATRYFVQRYRQWSQFPLRFDVVALSGPPDKLTVDWCQRAFECDS